MKENFITLFPYLLILSFLIFFPYFLGKGLWKLGFKGKVKNFKDFYQSLSFLTAAAYAVFIIVKVLIWTWRG